MKIETETELIYFLNEIKAKCEIPNNVTVKVSVPASVIRDAMCPYVTSIDPEDVPEKIHGYYLGIRIEFENTDKKIEPVSD